MLVACHLLTEQPREQPHKKLGEQPGTRKKNMSVQEKHTTKSGCGTRFNLGAPTNTLLRSEGECLEATFNDIY